MEKIRPNIVAVNVRNVSKVFGAFSALHDVSIEIKLGQLVALLGPSGSGKTTLLRLIAGLEPPTTGTIDFSPGCMNSDQDHRVGFVFQHYALFRHMTVFENIAFGLRVQPKKCRKSPQQIATKVTELLALVQLEQLGNRFPSQLSGGQKQRVALARALAIEPQLLLLDEPFGALDAKVRKELRKWLRRLHDDLHITSVFVTHDVDEALEVADEVVIVNHGQIEQIGTPDQIYQNPINAFVYQFIGNVNLFHCRVADQNVPIYVRPHELEIHRHRVGDDAIAATVKQMTVAGPMSKITLLTDQNEIIDAEIPHSHFAHLNLSVDLKVYVNPRKDRIIFSDYSI